MEEEAFLIERVRAGDQAAFGCLVLSYQRPVFNLAYRMLGTAAEAEEAAQETFLRAYRRISTYSGEYKFSSWLLAIASHYCVDRLRRRHITQLDLDDAPAGSLAEPAGQAPEPKFLELERQQEIQTLLSALPESYRAALVLRYWQDLSYEEMAEVLGTSEKAVRSRLHRAREMMAARLAERQAAHPQGRPSGPAASTLLAAAAWA